jgi:uncharacterized protein (DUF924 family)
VTTEATSRLAEAEELLEFWFADAATGPEAVKRRNRVWFSGGEPFDRVCSERFATTLAAAANGELDHWKDSPRGRLALIVLLDQLSRNINRGTARAYQQDDHALAACRQGIELGHDLELLPIERRFFYLPMEHAEDRDIQALSVRHCEALAREGPEELRDQLEAGAEHARQHRDIVERFGRFPHRNAVLGRASTADEEIYLADDAPRFGQ